MIVLVSGLVALAVFGILYVLAVGIDGQSDEQHALAGRDPALQAQLADVKGSRVTTFALKTANDILSAERKTRAEELLQVAGMPFRPAEWLVFRASVSLLAGVAVLALSRNVLVAAVGALLGWLGCVVYARLRASRRRLKFAEDLPDTLQLVAGSLRSGFSLPASLDAASQNARDPMASELKRVLARMRLGAELEDGLFSVARRMRSVDFQWVALVVQIQREVGGNLSDVLSTTVQTLRERFYLKRQVKALSAEGRISAYVLIVLPFVIGGFVTWRSPEYQSLLWTTGVGVFLLAAGGAAVTVGFAWMRRIIRIEL